MAISKEETIRRYWLMDGQLDGLLDENSKILCFKSGRRILVDSDFDLKCIEFKLKDGYVGVLHCPTINGKKYRKILSRSIMGLVKGDGILDHINRNTLDNRKCNLRLTTTRINALNRSNYQGKDKYIGVHKEKNRARYRATIGTEGCRYVHNFPERYFELNEVLEIYDCISIKLNGLNSLPNNPRENYTEERIDYIYNRYFKLFTLTKHFKEKLLFANPKSPL